MSKILDREQEQVAEALQKFGRVMSETFETVDGGIVVVQMGNADLAVGFGDARRVRVDRLEGSVTSAIAEMRDEVEDRKP